MNFRQLDLNLLRVLCAVYRYGSVTEAGRHLALSQPATSNALARLRAVLDDELFVRSASGLQPTRKAQRIVPSLIEQLRLLENTVSRREAFEPASNQVHWRLSLSDLGEMMFLPALAQVLRSQSPGSHVSNVAVAATQVSAALDAHEIDLAIGILNAHRGPYASELLFQENFVAVTASAWRPRNWRGASRLSAQQLATASLAVASPAATFHGIVDLMLTKLRLNERIVLRARHYGALPELVTRTDLLAIVPQMYAHSLAPRYDIRVWDLPKVGTSYDVHMLWHQTASLDPAHQWLRGVVRQLFQRTPPGSSRKVQP